MTIQVNITPNGRMSLPADLRKRLGLSDGGAVFLEETADGVVLRTAAQAVAHARAIAKRYTESRKGEASTDAFIAQRRTESGE
ncbi:AbrB family transcriptional regulator [Sphingomonas sp. S-NIH.Pt3_0716]|nr:AbrB family transcriptional regulator [Sphingomonas sp. S-NIH.Pt3_0716]